MFDYALTRSYLTVKIQSFDRSEQKANVLPVTNIGRACRPKTDEPKFGFLVWKPQLLRVTIYTNKLVLPWQHSMFLLSFGKCLTDVPKASGCTWLWQPQRAGLATSRNPFNFSITRRGVPTMSTWRPDVLVDNHGIAPLQTIFQWLWSSCMPGAGSTDSDDSWRATGRLGK